MMNLLAPSVQEEVALVLDVLTFGEIEIEGRLVDASNLALLGQLELGDVRTQVIYKPVQGERSLWDFPDGTLAGREAAAFVVSAVGGWNLVPPTVLRDGPLGTGSVQLWVDAVESDLATLIDVVTPAELAPGWLPVLQAQLADGTEVVVAHADRPELASAAVYDVVINNADRKGSHLVLDQSGSLWGFDHGVSCHVEPKLRTVLWGWAGQPLPDAEMARLEALSGWLSNPTTPVSRTLAGLLSPAEVDALRGRITGLLTTGLFPGPTGRGPAVPWPPL
ncbi:MAG TPA: SCO1664 family protein [Dermatophilaceae bacterium]|nr:SCO1664 family protein [Dermatophilaceae bacterium]